ncbi:hypothetical protein [Hasllibacter halocynthiae]|uniref:hypothetical protein n=1 Tax=Hasllibacter halocynthiae TaxID=595589 RepID=UPI0011B1CC06|nr:hypothetical protein [Hasllibacter halocynthiae]
MSDEKDLHIRSDSYNFQVGDAPDYDDIFVEIEFPDLLGVIIYAEADGSDVRALISVKSDASWQDHVWTRKVPERTVSLKDLMEALDRAQEFFSKNYPDSQIEGD